MAYSLKFRYRYTFKNNEIEEKVDVIWIKLLLREKILWKNILNETNNSYKLAGLNEQNQVRII